NAEAEHVEQTELPHHGAKRGQQRQQRENERLGKVIEQEGGDDDGDAEENQHALRALRDVANHLGETNDVNADLIRLKFRADLFLQRAGYLGVIEAAAGLRIDLQQRGDDGGAGEIVGDQHAHAAGFDDVLP